MTTTMRIILSGIVATAVMTMIMMIAPYMGLPKIDVAGMLSGMTQTPLIIGWLMHFMIGIFFAFVYTKYFNRWLHKIDSNILRGMLYGFFVFIFAQIMIPILMKVMPPPDMPKSENQNMILMMLGSLIGHLFFGGVLGSFYNKVIVRTESVA